MSPLIKPDGLHQLQRKDYDAIERVNFSTLKAMAKSPAHYRHGLVAPPEDTDAKKLGRAVHLAAFEPERFQRAIAVWDGGTRKGKDWDKFCEQNVGKELLTEAEHKKCIAIQAAVRADARAMHYVSGGRGEVSFLWTVEGGEGANAYRIECKGRIDFDAREAVVDLKSTKDGSPEGFAKQVVNLGYDVQAPWYVDGYFLATKIRKPYVIVAVENTPPHVVQVYRVPDQVLELGRQKYRAWIDRLAWCREHAIWPGYSDGVELDLELPRWAMPYDDVGELGLTSGGAPLAISEE